MVTTLDQVFREEWGRVLAALIGFVMTPAWNRATDRIRRDWALTARFGLLAAGIHAEVAMKTTTFPDERLELIFTS